MSIVVPTKNFTPPFGGVKPDDLKQIRVSTGAEQVQLQSIVLYTIDQEPVGFNVALPKAGIIAA